LTAIRAGNLCRQRREYHEKKKGDSHRCSALVICSGLCNNV
jgi:hypothetical protein